MKGIQMHCVTSVIMVNLLKIRSGLKLVSENKTSFFTYMSAILHVEKCFLGVSLPIIQSREQIRQQENRL